MKVRTLYSLETIFEIDDKFKELDIPVDEWCEKYVTNSEKMYNLKEDLVNTCLNKIKEKYPCLEIKYLDLYAIDGEKNRMYEN